MRSFKKIKSTVLVMSVIAGLLLSGCEGFSTKDVQTPDNLIAGTPDLPSEPPTPLPPVPPPPPPPPPPSPTGNCAIVTLSWDKNTESDLAGYRVYRGIQSNVLPTQIDVGLATQDPNVSSRAQYVVRGLAVNATHFFRITAYDFAGNESGRSVEASKTVTTCPKEIEDLELEPVSYDGSE